MSLQMPHPFPPAVPPLVPGCNLKKDLYDHDVWQVSKVNKDSKSVDICYRGQGRATYYAFSPRSLCPLNRIALTIHHRRKNYAWTIPTSRANKALRLLHPRSLELALFTPCGCSHSCQQKFTTRDLVRLLLYLLSNQLTLSDQKEVLVPATWLRAGVTTRLDR
jgi:hypothetical protein